MNMIFTDQEISHIKTLMNEGKDLDFIKEVYPNLTKHCYTRIKYGYGGHAKIEPFTRQQLKRAAKQKVMEPERPIESSEPKEKKYPRVVQLVIPDKEFDEELMEYFEGKKRNLERLWAVNQLKLYALRTGDFSDLPPSAMKDLEEIKERLDKGEKLDDIIKTA